MEFIKGLSNFNIDSPCAVTIGKFDALHLGHRYLIDEVVSKKKDGLKSVVVVFSTSPRIALGKDEGQKRFIITDDERVAMLSKMGVDILLELVFDEKMIKTEPEDFLNLISDKLNMRYLCVGEDFRFGYKGRGDITLIQAKSKELGFKFKPVKKLCYKDDIISSTKIRDEIVKGNLIDVNNMLGYDFSVHSKIVSGNKIGRTIDYPTINMIPSDEKILPPFGVYATRTTINDKSYLGMTNIGIRPTIIEKEKKLTIETYLFDFNDDIYEKEALISFLRFIRREKRFDSIADLKKQIHMDENEIRIINLQELS